MADLEKIARELNDEVLKAYMLPPRDAQLESWILLVTQVDELIKLDLIAAIRAWEKASRDRRRSGDSESK